MSDPNETKKLLEFKATLEKRLREVEQEIEYIKKGIEKIDSIIINTGFRTFSTPISTSSNQVQITEQKQNRQNTKDLANKTEPNPIPEPPNNDSPVEGEDDISVTGKDGTLLGNLKVDGNILTFTPSTVFEFTTDIPPFQSFLVERVLDNMIKTDQERASNGDLEPQYILEYSIKTDGNKIQSLQIVNYGGERRLRELNSSLRWTLDKMYDKLREG